MENPRLKVRKYKELNEGDKAKPPAAKTKVAGTSGKGGRSIAASAGVDMMSNAVEDRQASKISKVDEKLS